MKRILNISDFNEIVNGIKAMKADLVCVYGYYLIGVNNNMSVMKTYNMNKNINIEPFTIITKTLSSKFYTNITDTNIVIDTDNYKIYCPNNTSYAEESDPMINVLITNDIICKFINLTGDLLYNPMIKVIEFGNITNDLNFDIIRELKAADGAKVYYPNGNIEYGMYLYSGALPITKMDEISLNIYDMGEIFIGNFIIHKKKLNDINVYFKFVKLK